MKRLGVTGGALALMLTAAVPALAVEPPATPAASAGSGQDARSKAKARYESGVAAYREGRYRDAIELFLEADRLAPSAAFSFNVARAYSKANDVPNALRWYRDYLRRSPDASNASEVQGLVRDYEGELAKRGLQQLTVVSTPPAATVVLNGKPVGVTPWTGELPPGNHRLELSLRGFADAARDVVLLLEHAQDVSVALVQSNQAAPVTGHGESRSAPEPSARAGAAPADARAFGKPAGRFGPWPWITLGAGGAALGGALILELLRDGSEDRARRERTQIGYHAALEQMQGRQTASRVLAGVGGALIVGGGLLIGLELLPPATTKRRVSLGVIPAFEGDPGASLHVTF